MSIGPYSFEEYIHLVKSFHGNAAPGMIIGGIMVDLALRQAPADTLLDALCETANCLPDAVQLLTPCTVGNGWLRIVNVGRYAVSLYDKYEGSGVRVFLDPARLESTPAVNDWFFKRKPKAEQDLIAIIEQIRKSAASFCKVQHIRVHPRFLEKFSKGNIGLCPLCGEAYPLRDGDICRACQGETLYTEISACYAPPREEAPTLAMLAVEDAVGKTILHDMTRIVPHAEKGPGFTHGHVVQREDVAALLKMGKKKVYVDEGAAPAGGWVHENDAALAMARAMAGEGVAFTEIPREGKVTFRAERDGLLIVDEERLLNFNLVPDVMCASRQNYTVVSAEDRLAGARAIPLYLSQELLYRALAVLNGKPVFKVLPLRQARAGTLVTGTEVYEGLVEDRFIPLIQSKLEKMKCVVVDATIVPDDRQAIREGIERLLKGGIDLLVTTAGLSVDPDDVTRKGMQDAGATDMLYGAPVLPGAMTVLARIGDVQVIGVPAGALFFKVTAFDLLLPRLLAGLEVTRRDLARLSSGAFCLECPACTYPMCPFGR